MEPDLEDDLPEEMKYINMSGIMFRTYVKLQGCSIYLEMVLLLQDATEGRVSSSIKSFAKALRFQCSTEARLLEMNSRQIQRST